MEPCPKEELWWCNVHGRRALSIDEEGKHVCGPSYRGGIMLACGCVDLTGVATVEEVE
jgi:hypothetical protein